MLTTIATVLAGLLAAFLIVMGVRAFTHPGGAGGFGIPGTHAIDPAFRPWLQVKGLREIAAGVFAFVLLLIAPATVLGWYLVTLALIPVGDAVVVLRAGGPAGIAYGMHAATAAVMVAVGLSLGLLAQA